MNIKITLILIVVIVIGLGGYFLYRSMNSEVSAANPQVQGAAADDKNQVQGQDVKVGTGREAKPGDTVSILYVGKFTDGTIFDSSAAHGNVPLKFTLGTGGLIAGFQIGVNGMKEGGQRVLSIPPSLGYGAQDVKDASGKVIIPANSTLIFEIQLEKVEDTPAAATSN